MSQQIIDISTPDDGLGDVLRTGFDKTNQNFTELYNGKVDKITGKGLSENDFTDADKTKLDGIEAGAQVNVRADFSETDPTSDSFILNKPPSLYSAFGYFHVSDLETQTTPLAFVASTPLQLTNDNAGAFTSEDNAPYGVPKIWNASTNALDFTHLSVGDAVLVRTDLSISTTSVNQNLRLFIKFGIGTPSEYDLLIDSWNEKSVVSFKHFLKDVSFSIDNEDWRTAPAKIYILSDDDGSVKVNGWYIPIIRKSVNVIDFNSDPLKLDKVTTAGVERTYIINLDGSQGVKDTSDFKDVIFGYFNGINFYTDAGFTNLITAESGKIYVNIAVTPSNQYRWSGSAYVQIGGVSESDTYSYWFSYTASHVTSAILYTQVANAILATSGTQSLIPRVGENLYNSYHFLNWVSNTANGSNAGVKINNNADVMYRAGVEAYIIFGNNSDNINHVTAVGSYGLLSAVPNLDIANFTTDFVGVGNDPTDTNLSFYCKRNDATASYLKIPTNSNFPAHTLASDIFMLKFETNRVSVQADFQIKLTLTNLINGATISHTFTGLQCPDLNKSFINTVNRSNRNTGVATAIRWIKTHIKAKYF